MKVPVSWLKEYVPDMAEDMDIKELSHRLTMSGSKVETVEHLGADIKNVVVGMILSIEKHPAADKLVITKVDIGDRIIQIVTGATNLNASDYVPVALDGAVLHNGVKIKKGNLRGEKSDGMLCSIEELGYTRNDYPEAPENGIYVFPRPYIPGINVVPIMQLRDDVIEFEITSNRPDCISVVGIARETAATLDKTLKYPDVTVAEEAGGNAKKHIGVEIKNPKNCLRYAARVVKNVKIEPSPLWMRHSLTAAGVRPINNIVDITNYVMLELGQPMHAFDIDNIAKRKIIVRNARDGETFTTLDGIARTLDKDMTVIADPEKAVAIGGVMGGENSKVTENASAVLLESANFYGPNIRRTSKKLGLRTDSSSRFEKGLDPNLCEAAVNRAAHLIEQIGAGSVVGGIVDVYPEKTPQTTVSFSYSNINVLLGTKISSKEMEKYLNSLEITVNQGVAYIPSHRADITIEADLAEEVARLYGYDKIDTVLAAANPTVGKKNYEQTIEDIISETIIGEGFCEAMNYSFEAPKVFDKLLFDINAPERAAVTITNPLGEDFSVMRTVSINGILESLSRNYNRRNEDARLFEIAKVYIPRIALLNELPDEPKILTLGFYGGGDFFDLKGTLENLFHKLGIENVSYVKQYDLRHCHPGRCADVFIGANKAGYLGEVHPAVCKNYEIGTRVYIAALDVATLTDAAATERSYKPLPRFPGVKRDIALLAPDNISVCDIETAIREKGGKTLEDVRLFDVYTGDKIEKGFKSVAYSLFFRGYDKTLTEDEAAAAVEKILKNLESKLSIKLRT